MFQFVTSLSQPHFLRCKYKMRIAEYVCEFAIKKLFEHVWLT